MTATCTLSNTHKYKLNTIVLQVHIPHICITIHECIWLSLFFIQCNLQNILTLNRFNVCSVTEDLCFYTTDDHQLTFFVKYVNDRKKLCMYIFSTIAVHWRLLSSGYFTMNLTFTACPHHTYRTGLHINNRSPFAVLSSSNLTSLLCHTSGISQHAQPGPQRDQQCHNQPHKIHGQQRRSLPVTAGVNFRKALVDEYCF